jgi:hypothetical protein
MVARKSAAGAEAVEADAPAEKGGHYYDSDDDTRELMTCLLVLDDGQVVVGTGGSAKIVDAAKLTRVPSTAGEVLTVLGGLSAMADDIDNGDKVDTAALRRFVTAVDVWVRGIPGIPDSEK